MNTNKINKGQKKDKNQEKLIINSLTDLLNISLNEINNLKIENFSGIYFDKLYEEAIKSETQTETEESSPTKKLKRKKSIKHKSNKKIQKLIKSNSIDSKKQYAEEDDYEYIRTNEQKVNNEIKINKIAFSIKYNSIYGEEVVILGSTAKFGNWNLNKGFHLKWNEGNIWTGEMFFENGDIQNFEFKFVVVEKEKIKYWESGENNIFNHEELINNIRKNKIGSYSKYKYEYNERNNSLFIKSNWH